MKSLIKNLLFITLCLISSELSAQFIDDFTDGDFTNSPTWVGQTEKFAVTAGELELNEATYTGDAYLTTPSIIFENASWEFYHRNEANPSSNNKAEVYLMSDQSDLNSPLNGYFIEIGGHTSTTDHLKLYRQTGTDKVEILATADGSALNSSDEVDIRIKVLKDDAGNWEILADKEGGTNLISLATINDNTHSSSSFSGVKIEYTSGRREGYFFFDDFKVQIEASVDTVAPTLQQLEVLSNNSISLKFSETLEQVSAEDETNYMSNNGINFPSTAVLQNGNTVVLTFGTAFTNGQENQLTISGISDLEGNVSSTIMEPFIYNEVVMAGYNGVIITEIHPTPKEATLLPNAEFIEIFNPGNSAINLEDWTYQDGTSSPKTFETTTLNPGAYAIVCDEDDVSLFSSFSQVIGVSGTLSLNNSGDNLSLRNELEELIFHIEYAESWYRDNVKKEGGWSLEMIDTDFPCLEAINWRASNDSSGGTPAQQNSVVGTLEDNSSIELIEIEVVDSTSIIAIFSEKIDLKQINNISISVDNGIGTINNYKAVEPQISSILITFDTPLIENVTYTLTVSQVFDCAGNEIAASSSLPFGIPLKIEIGDLLINEVLFNPISGNVDFIELYNTSDKILTTKDLILAELDEFIPDSSLSVDALDDTRKLIFPNDYIVFSENPDLVKQAYFTPSPHKFLKISGDINFDDKGGVLGIFRGDAILLDQLTFSEDWHHGLIDDKNGVSLERLSIDQPTQDENNWHSASQNVGFATPTYLNSSTVEITGDDEISVSPEIISPNNDGFEDFTVISYNLEELDYVANVRIFDAKGRLVNHLVNNETTGLEGFYRWDGTNNNGEKVRTGIYILLFDLFDLKGNSKKFRKEIAVSTK